MACTKNIQSTLDFVGPFISYMPLTIGGLEPALTIANIVLQTILGPPFVWRWNRGTFSFTCITPTNTQDYVKALTDFGFMEKAWTTSADGKDIKEMEIKNSLSKSTEPGRPRFISSQGDDNLDNITLRLQPVPNAAFVVDGLYMRKARVLQALSQSWSPVPDEDSYIYQWGFLALASMLANDPRFPIFNQKFLSHLLGNQQGLDETQRNLFLGSWLGITTAAQSAALKTQQGVAARQQ